MKAAYCYACSVGCWRCADFCCSCGYRSGRAANIPWWSRLAGVILQILFLIVQCLWHLFLAVLRVIQNLLMILWPFLVFLIIGLVATYFFQRFAPEVLDFIMNALIPFINVIIDLWCFITYVALLIYRIVSMIWNMFVPIIGFILYVVVLLLVEVFLAILLLILDVLFDILALLLEVIIALVMLGLQILIVFITIQVELLLVLVEIIFPILMVVFEVITALLDIVVWILTVLFWVLEPILDALAALVGRSARAKRSFIPPSQDALLTDVFGPSFDGAARLPPDIPLAERAFLDSIRDLQRTHDVPSMRASYDSIAARLRDASETSPVLRAALQAPDPAQAIAAMYADRTVRPFTHADVVHSMLYMGLGPNVTDPDDPAHVPRESNALAQLEAAMARAPHPRERVKRGIGDGAGPTDPHHHVKRRYHRHSVERRARVWEHLSNATAHVVPSFGEKYAYFRMHHATDERLERHVASACERARNATGWHSHDHFKRSAKEALEWARDALRFKSYEHFLHTISPAHWGWHQWLQTHDPHRHSRRFYDKTLAERGEPDWEWREGRHNGSLAHVRTRRLHDMELSVLYDNDCFSSEDRHFLCLPEVPSNFSLCPPKFCSPFDLNNGTCAQFGYIDTDCVWCFARFKNAWVVFGYLLSLTFVVPLAVRTLANVVALPFLSDIILFIAPDDAISVQGILCTLIHLYDLLVIFATFLFFYLFVWPFLSALIECVRLWIEAWEDDAAYNEAWVARDRESRALEREIRNYLVVEAARRGGRTYWIDGPPGTRSRSLWPPPQSTRPRARDPYVDPVYQRYGVSTEEMRRELTRLPVSVGDLIGAHMDTLHESAEVRQLGGARSGQVPISARVVDTERDLGQQDDDDSMRALQELTQENVTYLIEYNAYRARVFMTRLNHFFGLEEAVSGPGEPSSLSRHERADLEAMDVEDWRLRLHHMRSWKEEIKRHMDGR